MLKAYVSVQIDAVSSWPKKKGFLLIKTKVNTSVAGLKTLNRIILKIQSNDHHHNFSTFITYYYWAIKHNFKVTGAQSWKNVWKPSQIQDAEKIIQSTDMSHILKGRLQIKPGYCSAVILFYVFSSFFSRTQIVIPCLLKSVFLSCYFS